MPITRDPTFATYKRELNHLTGRGRPFSEIEAWIDGTPLGDEAQSALWLYAWSYTNNASEPRTLRRTRAIPPPSSSHLPAA